MSIRAISYGGGVQSTALLVLAAQREIDFPLAIFANTGDDSEHPDTLRYVREVAMPYAAKHGIELVEICRTFRTGKRADLYHDLLRAERSINIPVRMANGAPGNRNCTVEYKIKQVARELKKRGATAAGPAIVALGISLDEYQRMRSESGIPHERLTYPLIDRRMDRAACVATIERAGIPVPPKSSCWFCPYKSVKQWRQMRSDTPDLFDRAVKLEIVLNEKRAALGKDRVFFSSRLRPLDEAITDGGQMDMFAPSCDIGGYCHA